MPGPSQSALQDEITRGRLAFNAYLAQEDAETAKRLTAAYKTQIDSLEARIRWFADAGKSDGEQARRLRLLRADIRRELDALQGQIIDTAIRLQANGAVQGYRAGLAALQRGGMAVMFHQPTAEAIRAGINYVDSPAWRAAVAGLGGYHADKAADHVLAAITAGQNPRQTAIWLREYFVTSQRPMVDALRMARTTQLYSARAGASEIYARSGIEFWVWSANLGNPRTCLACIALHGTKHPADQVLNDHHNGRCGPIPLTPRWSELGVDGGGELVIETGIDWFKRQPAAVQLEIMGPGMFRAWSAGEFRLQQVPRLYQNDIFGPMYRKATLKELLSGGGPASNWDVGPDGLPMPPSPTSGGSGGAGVSISAEFDRLQAENRQAYARAQMITPAEIEAGTVAGPLGDHMVDFFAYDNLANPVFSPELINDAKNDFLFEVYTLGRGNLSQQRINDARERAAAILAADGWTNGAALSKHERGILSAIASADDDAAIAGIDSVRDRRLKGAIAYQNEQSTKRGAYDPLFVSAAAEDAARTLREHTTGVW